MPMITILDIGKNPEFWRRMDPDYWDPEILRMLRILKRKWKSQPLNKALEIGENVISGDHVRPSRGERKGPNEKYEYYETKGFLDAGYDWANVNKCSKEAYERLAYTAVHKHDILVSCAGVGGVGRGRICYITHKTGPSCTGDVFILRVPAKKSYALFLFLKSRFGREQIIRISNGVGTRNINSAELLEILYPQFGNEVEIHARRRLSVIHRLHNKAMVMKQRIMLEMGMPADEAQEVSEVSRLLKRAKEKLVRLIAEFENFLESANPSRYLAI
ncbi:MAG: hypothetical protein DRP79_04985 [Planctomycetota bacterium]|nr:MAG: hypothetical protein DRP79_04985 [Planctomycetota bacterium]